MKKQPSGKSRRRNLISRLLAWAMSIAMVLGTVSMPAKAADAPETIAGWEFSGRYFTDTG